MTSRRARASFRLLRKEEERDLNNFTMEMDDLLEEDPDFQPEITQTGLDRGKVLQDYINSKKNPEAEAVQKWLEGQQENWSIEEIEAGTLNIFLGLYLISAKKKDWGEYEPTSLNSIFASIKCYLDDKGYTENIVTSDLFKGARDAWASKKKELKAMGMGNTPNKVSTLIKKERKKKKNSHASVQYTKCLT